jgi:hypothetical protein
MSIAVALAACRQPEQPIVPPPRPTDPTNLRATDPVLGSSIVSDAGRMFDAGGFDAGATPVRQVTR